MQNPNFDFHIFKSWRDRPLEILNLRFGINPKVILGNNLENHFNKFDVAQCNPSDRFLLYYKGNRKTTYTWCNLYIYGVYHKKANNLNKGLSNERWSFRTMNTFPIQITVCVIII